MKGEGGNSRELWGDFSRRETCFKFFGWMFAFSVFAFSILIYTFALLPQVCLLARLLACLLACLLVCLFACLLVFSVFVFSIPIYIYIRSLYCSKSACLLACLLACLSACLPAYLLHRTSNADCRLLFISTSWTFLSYVSLIHS